MKTTILQIIRNAEGYVSGQELCSKLGVSRTAVWKSINRLKEEGYRIEAVPNKGYRLMEYPDILSESEIKSRLHTKWAGQNIRCLSEVDSTNNEAKRLGENDGEHGTLVVADSQKSGKGRRGCRWESPAGTGIWITILLKPKLEPVYASMLTLVSALSMSKAVEKMLDIPVAIKWPNDLIINGKKICGILTEMSAELEEIHYVVVGLGVNANIRQMPEVISETATSLLLETGRQVDRAALIAAFLEYFEEDYECFMRDKNLHALRKDYEKRLINIQKTVRILDPKGEYRGIALGIDEQGGLLVRKEEGDIVAVTSGEVSVRGVYGYV